LSLVWSLSFPQICRCSKTPCTLVNPMDSRSSSQLCTSDVKPPYRYQPGDIITVNVVETLLVLVRQPRLPMILDSQSFGSAIICDEYWLCLIPKEKCGASCLCAQTCHRQSTFCLLHCVQKKNIHSHLLSYLHE